MNETNHEIKRKAAGAGVRLWEIADRLEMTDSNFSRMLRKELKPKEKQLILEIIERIEKEHENK